MKLRIRGNSLRLRLNQKEVDALSAGSALKELVAFPGDAQLSYLLRTHAGGSAEVSFAGNCIQIAAPREPLKAWADSEEIGLYYTLATADSELKIAIEKDLECIDGPEEERDPDAFSRELAAKVC